MMKQNKNIKVILSGGGTGGHIFPAIAIANAIKEKHPDAEFLFVGANGRMEMEKVPAAGYPIEGLNISGLQRKVNLENLKIPFKIISSLLKARQIIRSFKPDVAIGTGGYASAPTLRVASWMGIPSLIQEQNSFPGITNKILKSSVDAICVAYPDMGKYFPTHKLHVLGNPVRSQIENLAVSKDEACRFFGLDSKKNTVLVVGGSLGAKTINKSIDKSLEQFSAQDIQLIWQTGKPYAETAKNRIISLALPGLLTMPFITDMDKAYAAADIVVSRAGAIAISELCITSKASILVPSPNVTEDHQTKNALALVKQQAGIMVKDQDALENLAPAVISLAKDEVLRKKLAENIKQLAYPDAANHIAELALSLIKSKNDV